ncbi:hypothetical protein BP00DRAFT_89874 [Aspergillus indologenus CBS 114.80]|uniref:Uncharacterized protein n=1 Tax=Aspergillus indologenus CBS 114.80 TaxID=1450541 RepID=A0A2V5ID17_9EURO|nr:hypothetical protein BP00DRAFT_89874 [Aspergillus indologenus CBS 114.80]
MRCGYQSIFSLVISASCRKGLTNLSLASSGTRDPQPPAYDVATLIASYYTMNYVLMQNRTHTANIRRAEKKLNGKSHLPTRTRSYLQHRIAVWPTILDDLSLHRQTIEPRLDRLYYIQPVYMQMKRQTLSMPHRDAAMLCTYHIYRSINITHLIIYPSRERHVGEWKC